MEQTKTEFQRISTELELALAEYKDRYPKNFGHILRCHSGTIASIFCLFFMAACFLTLMPNLVLFSVFSALGIRVFAQVVLNTNSDEEEKTKREKSYKPRPHDFGSRVSDSVKGFRGLSAIEKKPIVKIEEIMAQLEPFSIYPDVENYCKGFCQQVSEVAIQKSKIREKYSKFSQYGLWTMGIILVVLFVRAAIIVEAT